ncbi:hypothetical protein JWG39_02740 [Desulforhopalus vacuolatus]|uniref:hypothetical protein n=1 Tax=Desulforhopalus vacuolatus TaxID=40414 RepID=UPI001964ADB8|nr:hypothetical protein [Desulforhopalus vacuolatus]MBM9518735.1 hypothetical protein [Desulforhopalus vacuolatus]
MGNRRPFQSDEEQLGWRETWQQSRQVLHRWAQILSAACAIPQLMAIYKPELWMKSLEVMPWRKESVVTAGLVRVVMQRFFRQCQGARLVEPEMP